MSKKICFVALNAYPVLAERNMGYGGGPEVLQNLLGKNLMKHGFKISFVVYGNTSIIQNMGGIRVIKVPCEGKSKVLKSFFVWKAMEKADADIYYHHSGATPIVALFCRVNKRKFICHIGSDGCVVKGTKGYHTWWLDIKLANVIIVQTNFQKLMLKKNFNKDGILIRNFFPITRDSSPIKTVPPIVLWIGAMSHVKQPWLFLKLAKKIPKGKFQMIGGIGEDRRLYEFIKNTSKKISNLDLLGHKPFHEIDDYFKNTSILVNTSKFEGYPNAFIQSWMNYTPVVSLNADPDEVICKYRLGFHSRTFEQLVKDVSLLLRANQLRENMGRNARHYVEKNHNTVEIIDRYRNILMYMA